MAVKKFLVEHGFLKDGPIFGYDMPTRDLMIQFEGLFDFDGMYAAITDWAKNYGYMWHEQDYKHKVPNAFGAEQEFKWLLTKRIDPYVIYEIKLHTHMYEMLDVEVNVGGKIKNLTKSRLYFKLIGNVKLDWQNKIRKGGPLGNWMSSIWQRVFTHDISGTYWDTLVYRVYDLQHVIKGYFDMQSKKYNFKGYLGED
ncbi:MAG: hypothetical protein ABIH82_05190 [Candidatus Woesearchaeota archaeon]